MGLIDDCFAPSSEVSDDRVYADSPLQRQPKPVGRAARTQPHEHNLPKSLKGLVPFVMIVELGK
jgi:isocitrate dehydrogenase kinase/phosphatase